MREAADPVYEDFLACLLRELAGGDLNRGVLLKFMGDDPRVSGAIEDLVRRGWCRIDKLDYLSITEEGRKRT